MLAVDAGYLVLSVIVIDPFKLDPEVAGVDNVMHLQYKAEVISREIGRVGLVGR